MPVARCRWASCRSWRRRTSRLTFDARLAAAIGELPDKQRTAVVARYVADLAYADVATLLGGSEAAARRSAADGIAKLRARLREHDDEP